MKNAVLESLGLSEEEGDVSVGQLKTLRVAWFLQTRQNRRGGNDGRGGVALEVIS